MARIVIIDDWINPKYISKSIKIDYIFIDPLLSLEKKNNSITTHASLVAKVLEHYVKGYLIGGILICQNSFSIGSLTALITYSGYVLNPVSLALNIKMLFAEVSPSIDRLKNC